MVSGEEGDKIFREEGKRRIYYGETSRSPYQRGTEHRKEILEGIATHPLVIHSVEEHQGQVQPVLMRTLSAHLTAMDRQIQESLNIIEESRKPGNCMNLKSEWAGAKIPGLAMHLPKGLAKDKTLAKDSGGATDQETEETEKEDQTGIGGQKRIRQNRQEDPGKAETGGVDQENHKKLRVYEPQPGNLRYNKPRTFLRC